MSPLPSRPRLADHARARRHIVDGDERIILHDARTGARLVLDARTWGLLACADGTRDLDGILAAAAREGARARAPALRAFLEQIHAAGLLEDGPAPLPSTSTSTSATPTPARLADAPAALPATAHPIDLLPDFTLHCDGHGSCCRFYTTVLFSPPETARARAALPLLLDAGDQPARAFLPERGPGPTAGAAVAFIDGRCAYLDPHDRCAIHAAAGAAAKPLGCQLFPVSIVDDGHHVRVSVLVECACVLASAASPSPHGAPLLASLPHPPRTRADLPSALHITELPARLHITSHTTAPRADLLAWSSALLAASPPHDIPSALWTLAATLERTGPDLTAATHAFEAPEPLTPEPLLPWLGALFRRAHRRATEDAAFRSPRDLALRTITWIAAATRALHHPDLAALTLAADAPAARADERFYLRAALHGHQLLDDTARIPLADRLRDAAIRLLVARAMSLRLAALAGEPDAEPLDDPASAHPLALVEAAMRGHGLSAYGEDLALDQAG
ncbi:YkgJ family cysteine cluster protein [Chondromyces apiculatus]|uniref:YkgJ family cysteine cluster protein n=1 Tax=Chondromyces apiculatus DSM 436 TaxID=1192034 RepID=A0A017SUI5_9BACT|nr:YkgJ family cysteine cluster protein [Chondromyces apiculatus]EYF00614.1 Hypothetical protein CAP_0429 [Chondromyces apiculatus DSM 436]